jgi:hypothetical protein
MRRHGEAGATLVCLAARIHDKKAALAHAFCERSRSRGTQSCRAKGLAARRAVSDAVARPRVVIYRFQQGWLRNGAAPTGLSILSS